MVIQDNLSGRERDTETYELSEEVYYYLLYVDGNPIALCCGESAYKQLEEVGKREDGEYEITTFGFPIQDSRPFSQ